MKRIFLFLATNLAVLLVISVSLRLLGVDRFLDAKGLDIGALMVFSVVVGFAGSIVSLLISRPLALALIQGVVNTFVVFCARIVGHLVDSTLFGRDRDEQQGGIRPGYYVTVFACEIVCGLLASLIVAWFSRQREFRADAGSARLLGTPMPMMAALLRLGGLPPGALPQSLRTFGITDMPAWLGLFASHPPVEARIEALQHDRWVAAAAAATSR